MVVPVSNAVTFFSLEPKRKLEEISKDSLPVALLTDLPTAKRSRIEVSSKEPLPLILGEFAQVNNDLCFLSISDHLQICKDLLKGLRGCFQRILWNQTILKMDATGQIRAQLYIDFSSPIESEETNLKELIVFIAKAFFLEEEFSGREPNIDAQKQGWLQNLQGCFLDAISEIHHDQIISLQQEDHLFRNLYDYGTEVDGKDGDLLKQLALKRALFPLFSDLLLDETPSLEKVRICLEKASLSAEKIASKDLFTVQLQNIKTLVSRIFPDNFKAEKKQQAVFLCDFLNGYLKRVLFGAKKTIRLHKNSWNFPFPFSAWLKVTEKRGEEKGLHFTPFSMRFKNVGNGTYKKIKGAEGSFFSSQNAFSLTSQVIVRIKGDGKVVLKGLSIQTDLLKLEGAEKFIMPSAEMWGWYKGRQRRKLELEEKWRPGTLWQASLTRSLPKKRGALEDETIPLDFLDFIQFAKQLTLGVDFLRNHGFFHRDIRLVNTYPEIALDGQKRVLIGDFDLITQNPIDLVTNGQNCSFWNYACRMGYASKETDCYTLVLELASLLIFRLKDTNFCNGNCKTALAYQKKLLENTQEIFDSLYSDFLAGIYYFVPNDIHRQLSFFPSLNQDPKELFGKIKNKSVQDAIREAVTFQKVFTLLEKTLQADLASKNHIEQEFEKTEILKRIFSLLKTENTTKKQSVELRNLVLDQKSSFERIFEESLQLHPAYPTLEEVKETLDYCEYFFDS